MAELHFARLRGPDDFEKRLVIKLILPAYSEDPESVQRFLREVRLAATLDHPNIVQVHDAGVVAGRNFLAMEYVHGVDVRSILRRAVERNRVLSLEETLTIVIAVCAGAHHAHGKKGADGKPMGIVHRDISPSNVLVGSCGSVKLADFGLACAFSNAPVTRPGFVMGKYRYLSPEQCRGLPVDRRADLFSIGVLLYELTTMTNAYPGSGDLRAQGSTRGPPARPSEVCPGYPRALEDIVMRCLQTSPDDRYPTAEVLQGELEHFAHDQRLRLSPRVLSELVTALFGAELEAQRVAQQPVSASTATVSRTATVPSGGPATAVKARVPQRRWELFAAAAAIVLTVSGAGAIAWKATRPPRTIETPAAACSPAKPPEAEPRDA